MTDSPPAHSEHGATTTIRPQLDGLDEAAVRLLAGDAPGWLLDRRLAALARYADQAWPDSRVDEFWRSTPFAKRFDVDLPVVDGSNATPPASLASSLDVDTARVTIIDGVVTEVVVPEALAAQGVVVAELTEAATSHSELVERHLGSQTTSDPTGTGGAEDRTITVNDAAWTAGVLIHVPDEVEVAGTIGVHVHVTQPGAHLPRVLAVLGHHAKATVYLEHSSTADVDALVDEVVELIVGDGATLDCVSLQEWGDHVRHLSLQKAAAHRDATVRTLSVTVGGATVRLRPEVDLLGPGSSARPLGLYFADAGQWFDLQPYVRHLAPHATSDVLFKGALQGRSRTVFRGNIFVHRDAVGTVTDETNRSMILSPGARADSTPFLEIECADIVAGHGSATGQIDARHLFYLESRGIPREQALRLLVHGFFRDVLIAADFPGVEARALAHIEREIDAVDIETLAVSDAALREELA